MALGHKKVLTPTDTVRTGCPRVLAPYYEESIEDPTQRRPFIKQYTLMKFSHTSETGVVKGELDLAGIHDDLRIAATAITEIGGASNIVVAKMSAEVLVRLPDGSGVRDFIVFDLKIPGARDGISYDYLRDLYKGRDNLYPVMEYFYGKGRSIANPGGATHGIQPAYDPDSPAHDQYILHTEQMLVAYLAHPKASEMLVNRLRAEIRAKHPGAEASKVYNMSLHMHSSKTCCAPCEYSLIGLMNTPGVVHLTEDTGVAKKTILKFSFLHHFAEKALQPSEIMRFTLPKGSSFRLFVTVTADDHDASHQKVASVTEETTDPKNEPFDIRLKRDLGAYQHVFLTKFSVPFYYDTASRLGLADTNLSDKTVMMSGSTQTKGSPVTMAKMRAARGKESDIAEAMTRLGFDDK